MLRRRNFGKGSEDGENVAVSGKDFVVGNVAMDGNRAPLVAIQDTQSLIKEDGEGSRLEKTPKRRVGENGMRTPEKYGGFSMRNRFGWGQKSEGLNGVESVDLPNATPKSMRSLGRTGSGFEGNAVQVTPTKSVNKPPATVRKVDGNGNGRLGTVAALYRNLTATSSQPSSSFNSIEVPHFALKEDPSFWMDHNVQVLIRVRPLNEMEKRIQGYNRCLKQQSGQTVTWVGPPETRFTFDHVACETVDQDTLFRMAGLPMVENCLSGYNSCMFAYGQTGSGKTYTMLGEIDELESNPSPHRGMTPRVFEFLFARIQAEEETRKEEKLKYSCKCSFLEIYNEQITDLLDPSATNLQLREDMKKGVYVENLSEFVVHTVSDILKLLSQGASNRKVASTNMNRESSRSHSVFTCVIESQWVKDATTNLRFARLNLVDLAGSERQKSSGAEGDRLKEAASINKSLSTLGHVIMVLLEVAQGKPKHVPYRDSKLTFLLQDSLGGNSKTMIIANVSSASCCATETLNTLKFAQRAKLIQNNAVVNEDSSGDVSALQQQIRILKEELVSLKRQNVSRSLSFGGYSIVQEEEIEKDTESKGTVRMSCKQFKSLETTLAGSLRREQMAESSIKQLEAEIEHLNRLVRQREEDARSSKMMLKFRDDKISRMELLVNNLLPVDSYLIQENNALYEEIQLLTAKLDRNPEVTRFALENIRLLDQIRRFQDFYEEGEKEMILSELSELRKQLLQHLEGCNVQPSSSHIKTLPKDGIHEVSSHESLKIELKRSATELEECRSNLRDCLDENAKLNREISALQKQLNNLPCSNFKEPELSCTIPNGNNTEDESSVIKTEELLNLKLELDIVKVILQEDMLCHREANMKNLELARENLLLITRQCTDAEQELHNSKSVIEALESQQIMLINEIDDLKKSNDSMLELLNKKEAEILDLKEQVSGHEHSRALSLSRNYENEDLPLQTKLTKMHDSLEKAKNLNTWYQKDLVSQNTSSEEMEKIRRQAEVETAEVIVCMQEELSVLQQQIKERNLSEIEYQKKIMLLEDESRGLGQKLIATTQECNMLDELIRQKDGEIKTLCDEWKSLTCTVEEVLSDGNESLKEASTEVAIISNSFPRNSGWVSEQVGQMAKVIYEKEILISELKRSLEDANVQITNLDVMLSSLKGAALVINDSHQNDLCEKRKEVSRLSSQLNAKSQSVEKLDLDNQLSKEYIKKLSFCATAAFVIVNNISETKATLLEQKDALISELKQSNKTNLALAANQALAIAEAGKRMCCLQEELNDVNVKHTELETVLADEKKQVCFLRKKLQEFEANEILMTKQKLTDLQAGVSTVMSSIGLRASFTSNLRISTSNSDNIDTTYCIPSEGVDDDTAKFLSNLTCLGERKGLESNSTLHGASHKDNTMSLLRNEIESALESLTAIRVEMAKLQHEKDEAFLSERKRQSCIDSLKDTVIALQTMMINFEEHVAVKVALVEDKLQNVDVLVEDANICLTKTKGYFESQVIDSKSKVAHNVAEVEALHKEREVMVHEIQQLRSTNETLSYQIEVLEKDFTDTKGAILELEATIKQAQDETQDDFQSLLCNFKYHLSEAQTFMRSSFNDIWCDIFERDCVVSVLHLCHSGFLLETLTKQNAENGLLQDKISDQYSVIDDLKELNRKSRESLELCRTVEGKLLTDTRKSFDRVRRKEEETRELDLKLTAVEQKILDLKAQEELMMQRSDAMGYELANLMNELEKSNSSAMAIILEHEKLLKDQQDYINSQTEIILVETLTKNIEKLAWASKLEEVTLEAAISENERIKCIAISEDMKEQVFLHRVDGDLKDLLIADSIDQLSNLMQESTKLENERNSLSSSFTMLSEDMETVKSQLETKNAQSNTLGDENQSLRNELKRMEEEKCLIFEDLKHRSLEYDTFISRSARLDEENKRLHGLVATLESTISGLQSKMHIKEAELSELDKGISFLKSELDSSKNSNFEVLSNLNLNNMKSREKLECAIEKSSAINGNLKQHIVAVEETVLVEMSDGVEMVSQFIKDLTCVEAYACTLLSTNESLQSEFLRMDETVKGLLSDSTFAAKIYEEGLQEMSASLEDLTMELSNKNAEIDVLKSDCKTQEAMLQDKLAIISNLNMFVDEEREKVQMLFGEKSELMLQLKDVTAQKLSVEEELDEKQATIDNLESELMKINRTLIDAYNTIESMEDNLDVVAKEKDHLQSSVLLLEEKLDIAEAQVQETEAIATEAKQMAESERFYLEEREEEIRLLERSIEELESTIDVLENKVEMVKGEAERQRLQREELEVELHALKNQTMNFEFNNTDIRRHLSKKETDLEETLQRVQVLERELANKDTEIAQLKTHISELNVHAEAQACEYKQKFKALESMAEKVKLEGSSGPGVVSSSNKLERNASKPRGSGSPFKCMGLGLVQQMKSEKDEDLTDAKRRIEELQALAANRQKEIFMLNSRLAAAESMTHDVIRELLGVKLDMNQYASLLDTNQVHSIAKKAMLQEMEPQTMDVEVAKLKQQLSEFIEERKGWLDEIDRKHAELVSTKISLEKLQQANRSLKADNQTLMMENSRHKKQVIDLENEVNKLSGQQNLQQRIHHHAKVKEENNFLRSQNEDLSLQLRRANNIISRVKEELGAYRASFGKSRNFNFDDQEQLHEKLKETEEEKLQLAQKLLSLCTSILKVAGTTSTVAEITVEAAEEALGHLQKKIISLERVVEDLNLKNKITTEKARLSELMPQLSPLSPKHQDRSRTPGRISNAPFLSTLDR